MRRKEDVTWSVLHGGGWSKTHRITRGRVGAELAPSSTMKNAPCHIPHMSEKDGGSGKV